MTNIKICGLTRPEDIASVNALKPEYIGFVFAKSKRQVTRAKARELKNLLKPEIKAVGVFVKEEVVQIAKVANEGIIDLIQLHGDETPEFCHMLKQLTKVPVIKVIRIKDKASLENLEVFNCDYYLFDTYSKSAYGGSGVAFDYRLLSEANPTKPFFLAGGLNTGNVKEIISAVHPFGVDVSGGVETEGVKDYEKIASFINTVRRGE